jgi:hypothetical protein
VASAISICGQASETASCGEDISCIPFDSYHGLAGLGAFACA